MFYLKKILSVLVLPPASLIVLIAAGLLMIRRWPRAGYVIAWIGTLALLVLSLPATSILLVRAAVNVPSFSASAASGAQAIVILSAGRRQAPEYGGETLSQSGLERARYGATLARELGLPILVTGGSVYGRGLPVAELMAEALRESFHTSVEWIEPASRDTHENALYSARILRDAGIDTVILVTHDIHLRRGMAEFAALGIKTIPAPVTTDANLSDLNFAQHLPNAHALRRSSLALHEIIGYLVLAPKS